LRAFASDLLQTRSILSGAGRCHARLPRRLHAGAGVTNRSVDLLFTERRLCVREGSGRAALLDNAGEVVELVGATGEQTLSPDLVVHRLDLHRHGDALFGGFQVDVGLEFVRRDVWYEVDEGGVGESVRPALDQYQAAIDV